MVLNGKIVIEDKVTIIIKTFERADCLDRLIKSIKIYYPYIDILVGDDSAKPIVRTDVEYYSLPFDVGVSAGRNFLIDKVKTKYFVTLDDDFIFDEKTKLENFLNIIENNNIDILAGGLTKSVPTECANIEVENNVLTVIPLDKPVDKDFYYCDYAIQFFIANTEKFKRFGGWDEELKTRGEHIELFLRAKGKLKVAATRRVIVTNDRSLPKSNKYNEFRRRDHLPIGMKKHGIRKLINHNGKEKCFV